MTLFAVREESELAVMYYGYHRVSTAAQKEDRGISGIESFCRERGYPLQKVYVDKISGKTFERPRYIVLKEDVLRPGDTLIIWELDRLGRTKADIIQELAYFKENSIRVMFLDIPTTTTETDAKGGFSNLLIDTINNILIEILSMMAQNENERNRKRSEEGRAAMKARGEWGRYGRPRRMSKEDFAVQYGRVVSGLVGSLELQRELGLNRDTYFRYVREYKASVKNKN